uniref:Truncated putative replication protein n=1 Tax=Xanthomonas campestris pv. glycines TaxID=473421 RepID=Q8GLV5_XANCG|nr:truncated putative replication protein [Xanthomonas citri pv. glycines]
MKTKRRAAMRNGADLMIDWLTMVVPCKHQTPIDGGKVLCVDANGELSWESKKKRRVEGSFGGSIGVATAAHEGPDPCTHLWIDGNPAKWFQGHNLWGTDDLHGLAVATIEALVEQLGLTPTDEDRAAWAEGRIRLTRVDCTESFHLRSRREVLAWLASAEQTAHLANRGRGQLMKGSTLYFGKNSRRWSLKLYSKGQEIRAKGHG